MVYQRQVDSRVYKAIRVIRVSLEDSKDIRAYKANRVGK